MPSIRQRAGAVVDHHYDTTSPHKPLWLMFPGGAVAVVALLWAVWIGYQGWFAPHPQPAALALLPLTLVLYFAGVFAFSYGYELCDTGRAVKLTIKLGLIGLAAVLIVVALVFALGALSKGKKLARSSGSGSTANVLGGVGRLVANTALRSGMNLNLGGINVPLVASGAANVCSFCARPLPPPGSPTSGALVDPDGFCPKCGQPFEPAGERAKAAVASSDAAAVSAVQKLSGAAGSEASCLKCGVFGWVDAQGLCPACAALTA